MIPFFVVDRPMSLNIVKTFFANHPGVPFGLMTHALVSKEFRQLYAGFPCERTGCWLRPDRGPCHEKGLCDRAKALRKDVVKAVDCGIFSDGRPPTYRRLFKLYDEMGARYGMMKDIFGDPAKTLESAIRAVDTYRRQKRRFELVLVAHGKTAEQYVASCRQLAALGIGRLAIGGLLVRKKRSARYSSAGSLERIASILGAVRDEFPKSWLFVLGCYHPKRHALFLKHRIYGSDYKGWIFNYAHRLERLAEAHEELLEYERGLRPKASVTKKATKRHGLWLVAARARTNYAVTKNRSRKESDQKAKYREELQRLLFKVKSIDKLLAQARHEEAQQDGLPRGYRFLVNTYRRLVKSTDQEVRVAGVHDYLKTNILPKVMRQSAVGTQSRGG